MCNAYNHPPGCTCGWGGDGHAGRSYGGWTPQVFSPPTPQYRSEWKEQEFTRPTDCPICGADVFFIRHNGGCVWVDELGWPWPKHACFDTPSEPTTQFYQWTAKSSRLTNPLLGIVLGFRLQPTQSEPRLVIRLTDSSRVSLILRWTPVEQVLLGALVVFSVEDSLLLHQQTGEIAFHSFIREQQKPAQPGAIRGKTVQEKIDKAIVSVAKNAWFSVVDVADEAEQLKLAKQEALRLISMLSPSIKRQVIHHFTSQKWQPLIARRPRSFEWRFT